MEVLVFISDLTFDHFLLPMIYFHLLGNFLQHDLHRFRGSYKIILFAILELHQKHMPCVSVWSFMLTSASKQNHIPTACPPDGEFGMFRRRM